MMQYEPDVPIQTEIVVRIPDPDVREIDAAFDRELRVRPGDKGPASTS